jgi:hypothetical protein
MRCLRSFRERRRSTYCELLSLVSWHCIARPYRSDMERTHSEETEVRRTRTLPLGTFHTDPSRR